MDSLNKSHVEQSNQLADVSVDLRRPFQPDSVTGSFSASCSPWASPARPILGNNANTVHGEFLIDVLVEQSFTFVCTVYT